MQAATAKHMTEAELVRRGAAQLAAKSPLTSPPPREASKNDRISGGYISRPAFPPREMRAAGRQTSAPVGCRGFPAGSAKLQSHGSQMAYSRSNGQSEPFVAWQSHCQATFHGKFASSNAPTCRAAH